MVKLVAPGIRRMQRDEQGKFRSENPVRAIVPVRMTEADKERLAAIAEAEGKSTTILAREILLDWMEKWEEDRHTSKRAA